MCPPRESILDENGQRRSTAESHQPDWSNKKYSVEKLLRAKPQAKRSRTARVSAVLPTQHKRCPGAKISEWRDPWPVEIKRTMEFP